MSRRGKSDTLPHPLSMPMLNTNANTNSQIQIQMYLYTNTKWVNSNALPPIPLCSCIKPLAGHPPYHHLSMIIHCAFFYHNLHLCNIIFWKISYIQLFTYFSWNLNVYISEIYEADKKAYGLQSKTYDENYGCPCEEAGRGCITLPSGSRWPFLVQFFNVPQEFWEILVGS